METKNIGIRLLEKSGYTQESLSAIVDDISEKTIDEFKSFVKEAPEIQRLIMYFFACPGYESIKKKYNDNIQSKLLDQKKDRDDKKMLLDIKQMEEVSFEGQFVQYRKLRKFHTVDPITQKQKLFMVIGKPYMKEKKQSFAHVMTISEKDTPNAFSYSDNEFAEYGF